MEEHTLLANGSGFFTEIYKKFGLSWDSPLSSSLEFLSHTGILTAKPLRVHSVTA